MTLNKGRNEGLLGVAAAGVCPYNGEHATLYIGDAFAGDTMTGPSPQTQSFRTRSRQWTTMACAGAALVGVAALNGGHHFYGGLALVGALVLLKDSSLVRRRSRHADADVAAMPRTARRPLRKAA
jgi:hypothetical protein